jgi:hypothetical protein
VPAIFVQRLREIVPMSGGAAVGSIRRHSRAAQERAIARLALACAPGRGGTA